jgi:hypothetical protein
VHAYFPLASADDHPDRGAIWRGWDRHLTELGRLSRLHDDKPVLFAEIGYPRSPRAAVEPWIPDTEDTPAIQSLRRTLIEVAAERIEETPFITGMFWWKWIPGDDRWDRDFSMKDSEARQAVRASWDRRPATPTTPR